MVKRHRVRQHTRHGRPVRSYMRGRGAGRIKPRAATKSVSRPATVMKRIEKFIEKLGKKWDFDPMAVVEWHPERKIIEVRTDGDLYDFIYDPSSGEPFMLTTADKVQADFEKMIQDMGWWSEPYGQGIIHVYRAV